MAQDQQPLATMPNSGMPANMATRSQLRKTIKYPPPKPPKAEDDERSIDVAFKNGGAGKTLKESPEARHYNTTTKDEEARTSKAEARYVDGPVAKRPCKSCSMFVAPDACTKVEGTIAPDGHCRFWDAATGLSEDRAIAFDRASVREIDRDGKLHVEITNISKANVCGYLGKEIPGYKELRLEPEHIYQLLRDPEELAKPETIKSFNNMPLLSQHIPVFAEDYAEQAKQFIVGATGTDAVFEYPYLRNSLVVWDGDAIKAINVGMQEELSCGYHYVPIMESGVYNGTPYDGKMTQIYGNHLAIVKEGRAGSDVCVADSALIKMAA